MPTTTTRTRAPRRSAGIRTSTRTSRRRTRIRIAPTCTIGTTTARRSELLSARLAAAVGAASAGAGAAGLLDPFAERLAGSEGADGGVAARDAELGGIFLHRHLVDREPTKQLCLLGLHRVDDAAHACAGSRGRVLEARALRLGPEGV